MALNKEVGRIVKRGMGGFLCPPGHPEHDWSVEYDLRRRPENRGSCGLSYARVSVWLDDAVKAAAKKLLDDWAANKLPLNDPAVVRWCREVLGYFAGCYAGDPALGDDKWNVAKLCIDRAVDPVLHADIHAGVHLIRKYYPEFAPSAEDFAQAKWGD